jgi:dTDP-4-dehydrorhamnose reductase
VPSGFVSWHGFANAIIKELNRLNVPIKTKYVAEVDSKKMKQIALRPKNSRLNNAVLVGDMKVEVPPWAELLPELVSRTLKTL